MENYIFVTVGNVRNFREVSFSYQNRGNIRRKLSALAVAEFENLQPVIFVPHSLNEEDVKLVEEISKKQNGKTLRSPSFGTYDYHYRITFYPLVFYYLFHFLRHYRFFRNQKFFIDISVGLNQLTFAMVEALRFFSVFSELSNLGTPSREKPEFYIVYSEPVLGRENSAVYSYKIYRENFEPKAFLSLPVKWKDIGNLFANIDKLHIDENSKREFKELTERALYTLLAVTKNIPLSIYLLGYDNPERITQFLRSFIKSFEPILGDESNPPDFEIDKESGNLRYLFTAGNIDYRLINNALLLLGFYLGISRLLKKSGVPWAGNTTANLKELSKKFSRVYRTMYGENNPNENLLEKDTKRLNSLISKYKNSDPPNNDNCNGEWINGACIDPEHGYKSPDLRNFIAHSGLLTALLEVNVKGRRVRYYKDQKDTIKELLCSI